MIPIVSPDLISRVMSFNTGSSELLLYEKYTWSKEMLPSATFITGFSGFVRSAFSSITSAIRFPLASAIVIITNMIASIIRLIRILMQYVRRLIRLPVERFPATIMCAPNQLIRRMHT